MATQLYEVDVFMFFLKDLEAVTTNFYHDLWQSTRMHTPKVFRHRVCLSTHSWLQHSCAYHGAAAALLSCMHAKYVWLFTCCDQWLVLVQIPLAAMAGGDTSDDLSGLIKQQLLV